VTVVAVLDNTVAPAGIPVPLTLSPTDIKDISPPVIVITALPEVLFANNDPRPTMSLPIADITLFDVPVDSGK
jgi:hypothetical protein